MENIALVTIKVTTANPGVDDANPISIDKPTNQPERNRPSAPTPPPTVEAKSDGAVQHTLGVKFISAGLAACFADMVTFPLDTAKVRLQIQGEGTVNASRGLLSSMQAGSEGAVQKLKYRGVFGTVATISKEEGVRALYNGLVPGLQRQMAFASIRIGLYDTVKQAYIDLFNAKDSTGINNVGLRILAGITTGAAAVSCAQPTDVVKVRMQAQGKGPKRYNGCMNAYRTIAVQEGMRGLWKGTMPNIARNAIVNAAELVSYDLIKEAILRHNLLSDNMPCHFVSAFGAGFCTTVVASPVDVVKTRYMNSGAGKYRGAADCALSMYREKGFRTFYKGFMPSYMRLGSWNIVMFVTFEQLKRFFSHMQNKSDNINHPALSEVSLQSNSNGKKFL